MMQTGLLFAAQEMPGSVKKVSEATTLSKWKRENYEYFEDLGAGATRRRLGIITPDVHKTRPQGVVTHAFLPDDG